MKIDTADYAKSINHNITSFPVSLDNNSNRSSPTAWPRLSGIWTLSDATKLYNKVQFNSQVNKNNS